MIVALLIIAVLIGGLLAVQASANLQLNKAVGTPYGASTLQLWFAAALLAVLAAAPARSARSAGVADVPGVVPARRTGQPALHHQRRSCCSRGWARSPPAGCSSPGRCSPRWRSTCSVCSACPGSRSTCGIVVGAVAVLAGITVIVRGSAAAHRWPCRTGRRRPARCGRASRRAGCCSASSPAPRCRCRARSTPSCAPSLRAADRRRAGELRGRGAHDLGGAAALLARAARPRPAAARRGDAVVGLARRRVRGRLRDRRRSCSSRAIGAAATVALTVTGQQLARRPSTRAAGSGCPAGRSPPPRGGVRAARRGIPARPAPLSYLCGITWILRPTPGPELLQRGRVLRQRQPVADEDLRVAARRGEQFRGPLEAVQHGHRAGDA